MQSLYNAVQSHCKLYSNRQYVYTTLESQRYFSHLILILFSSLFYLYALQSRVMFASLLHSLIDGREIVNDDSRETTAQARPDHQLFNNLRVALPDIDQHH